MRSITIWLFVFTATTSAFAQENLRPDVPVAIVGGMLLDGYEAEPIHHSVVVFENGRITAVGQKHNTVIPDNAVIIDAGGRTVMPGLIDAHSVVGLAGYMNQDNDQDQLEQSEAIQPELRACRGNEVALDLPALVLVGETRLIQRGRWDRADSQIRFRAAVDMTTARN